MPSREEGREGDCTRAGRGRERERVAGARYRSAVDRVLVGHRSNHSSGGWLNIEVVVVASSMVHSRRMVVGRRAGWEEDFQGEEPSMLCRRRGGDRGCDGGGR